jgi:hypothetical protein
LVPKYLRLYGDIGEDNCSAAAFTAELAQVPEMTPVVVTIHSGGGNYFDGVAISNALKKRRDVTVRVDGLAATPLDACVRNNRQVHGFAVATILAASRSITHCNLAPMWVEVYHGGCVGVSAPSAAAAALLNSETGRQS